MVKYSAALACALAALILASTAHAQQSVRGWVDVNVIAGQSNQGERLYSTAGRSTLGGAIAVGQDFPEIRRGSGFDVEGGYMFGPRVGFGVRWAHARAHSAIGVGLGAEHPITGAIAMDGAESDEFRRLESAIDLMAAYTVPLANPDIRLRVFGGPTHFVVEQAMIRNVNFTHTLNFSGTVNQIAITNISEQEVNGNAWGYNAGADVAYFFARHVGVGAGLRFNRGTVGGVEIPLPNPVGGDEEAEFTAGHLGVAAGVRFRF